MRKILCILLCLAMLLISAVGFSAPEYTLPEKMGKQLQIGSGLKGSILMHGEGNDPILLTVLQPLMDVELEFRGLTSGEEAHYYVYQAGEDETRKGLTELYIKKSDLYFRSDLLPGETYRIPEIADLIDLMTQPEGGNPSVGSAIYRWFSLKTDVQNALLTPVKELLESRIEMWLAQYAGVSEVRTAENGTSVIDLVYTIPMAELKQEIVQELGMVRASEAGQALLDRILNPEQKELFTNEYLDYYFLDALNALNNDFDVHYTRTVSVLGDPVSSVLELPLDERTTHYQMLTMEESGGLTACTLQDEERLISFLFSGMPDWNEVDSVSAWVIIRPNPAAEASADQTFRALRIDLAHSSTVSTDEDARDHLRETWKMTVERDVSRLPAGEMEENYQEEIPQELEINLHYFSRNAQSSPTNLEIEAHLKRDNLDLTISGKMKTASPWELQPFSTEQATDFTAMTKTQLSIKAAEFLASASEQMVPDSPGTADQGEQETTENSEEIPLEETEAAPELTEAEEQNGDIDADETQETQSGTD